MCNPEPEMLTLAQAAKLTQLDPHNVCWAIEERGHCSTDDYDILPANDDLYIVKPRRPR